MPLGNFVKKLQDAMRCDPGVNGDAQRIEQIVWILFLKIYDCKEADWEFHDSSYKSAVPVEFRWRNWAVDRMDGSALSGERLLDFVNNRLFPALRGLEVDERTPMRKAVVKYVFEDCRNYQKDGVSLRRVLDIIDGVDLGGYDNRHALGEIYETILRSLQSAGNAGEFYTPRALTDFMARTLSPKIGERIADFACGTGGFLVSALKVLENSISSVEDREKVNASLYGVEKKPLPYMLCVTNMLLHGLDNPGIVHGNSLERRVQDYSAADKFDVVLMNPPYGGNEMEGIKANFPPDLRGSETADLFMALIMYRLRPGGRAAVVLPDGFLFGRDGAKLALKRKLFSEFDVHTVVRLPGSVFSPYTSIATNILFFNRTHPTKSTWFYRLDMPAGYKHFSKTKPIEPGHFNAVSLWWNKREPLSENGFDKAREYGYAELERSGFNLDLCGFPREREEVLTPFELIANYRKKRAELGAKLDALLDDIIKSLGVE